MSNKSSSRSTSHNSSLLSEARFQKLTADLSELLQNAETQASQQRLTAYWQAGKRITREHLQSQHGYHNSVLRTVASQVGVTARTLQRAVALYDAYQQAPPSDELSWAHYRCLATLPTKKERDFYTRYALRTQCAYRELELAIRQNLYAGGPPTITTLKRPSSPLYLFQARTISIIDADTLDVSIDLGFNTWTERRLRLAEIDAPEPDTRAGRDARNFLARTLKRAATLLVQTEKQGTHGRYLAHILYSPTKIPLPQCFNEGIHLNQELLQNGHAHPQL